MKKIIEIFKGIGILLLYLLLPTLLSLTIKPFVKNFSDNKMTIVYVLLQLVCSLVIVLIFRKTLIKDFKDMKANYNNHLKIGFKYWIWGLILMIIFNFILNFIINPGGIATNEEINRTILDNNLIFALFAIIICAPITEELVFRAAFKKAFKKAIVFAIFSGLLFAFLHITTAFLEMDSFKEVISNWKQILYIFPYASLGVAFGLTYFKTDNIFSTIIIHAIHNTITVLLLLLLSFVS